MTNTAQLERLFEKYKFTKPIPGAARERLIESRERIFRSTLKELGVYSLWYAVILFVFFKLRSVGIKSSIVAAKTVTVVCSLLTASIIVSGTYTVYRYFYADRQSLEKNEINDTANVNVPDESFSSSEDAVQKPAEEQTQNQINGPVSEIRLYNGRIYRGVIISRGKSYVISTARGRITIPAKQIRLIKRAK